MVELTNVTGRAGLEGCLKAATSPDNIPTYAGLGVGIISGNVVAKESDKLYTNTFYVNGDPAQGLKTAGSEPNKGISFLIRSAGRLVASVGLCAVSGSLEGNVQTGAESAAIGSAGMIAVDLVKTYGPGETLKDWADLSIDVPQRRYAAPRTIRATSRPVALQGRPAMEAAALEARPNSAGKPMMETAALSSSGASLY